MRILIVDDEPNILTVLKELLEINGYEADTALDGREAVKMLETFNYEVIISDIRMPNMDGMELLKHTKRHYPHVRTLMFTAYGSIDNAVEAMKIGAYGYLTKPLDKEQLFQELDLIRGQREILRSGNKLQTEMLKQYARGDFQTRNQRMQNIYQLTISRIARSDTTVLIEGESGTGKELMAGMIHHFSNRKTAPFIKINCAALAEGLLESELFGHVKGAFTGAEQAREGRFAAAHGGTLFLDEVADMSPALQVKLLRVLQEGEFEPVGSNETRKVDVRLITATNKRLRDEVEKGNFRQDLFYRLNVINIVIPPLRERREDIPQLIVHFMEKYRRKLGLNKMYVRRDAYEALLAYDWPGNIRELENVMERALVLAEGDTVELSDLPPELREQSAPVPAAEETTGKGENSLAAAKERFERQLLEETLSRQGGNISNAARELKIARKNLQQKIKKYQINVEQFRANRG